MKVSCLQATYGRKKLVEQSLANLTLSEKRRADLTHCVFGRLTVIGKAERDAPGRSWNCKCSCDRHKLASTANLLGGGIRSCGCLRQESQNASETKRRTHGLSKSPEFRAWMQMRRRCYSPTDASYKRYGGRGILVCRRWRRSFEAFLADMGPMPFVGATLDRIKNHKGYELGNCRWATMREQQNNKTNNKLLTVNEVTRTLSQWAESKGVKASTIGERLKAGWTVEKAILTPTLSFRECGINGSQVRWRKT